MAASKAQEVVQALKGAGLTPSIEGDKLIVRGPRKRLTEELRRQITENRPAIMALVFDESAVAMMSAMFRRVNQAYDESLGLARQESFLEDEEKRIDAAYLNRDLRRLEVACRAYEQAALARFRIQRQRVQVRGVG